MSKNRQLRVKAWPKSLPGPEHFKIVEALVPTPRDAEVLIRNLWLSIDPYYRQSLGPRFVGTPFCHPGDVMMSVTLGQVIESRDPAVPVGRYVTTLLGKMQDFAVVSGRAVRLLPDDIFGDGPGRLPLSTALGVAGIPGLTAYAALTPPTRIRHPARHSSFHQQAGVSVQPQVSWHGEWACAPWALRVQPRRLPGRSTTPVLMRACRTSRSTSLLNWQRHVRTGSTLIWSMSAARSCRPSLD